MGANIQLLDIKEHDNWINNFYYVVTLKYPDEEEPIVFEDFGPLDVCANLSCGDWKDVNGAYARMRKEQDKRIKEMEETA